MNLNLKMTVERSKRRSQFLSLVFITKCLLFNFFFLIFFHLSTFYYNLVRFKIKKEVTYSK